MLSSINEAEKKKRTKEMNWMDKKNYKLKVKEG